VATRSPSHHLFCYSRWLRNLSLFLLYTWMQRKNVINQRQPQLLKYVDASQANELALTTNVLGYISTLSSKASFLKKCSSFTILGCFGILSIKRIYIWTRTHLATLANWLLWSYKNYSEHLIMLGIYCECYVHYSYRQWFCDQALECFHPHHGEVPGIPALASAEADGIR